MRIAPSSDRATRERLALLLAEKARRKPIWTPLRGPQTLAFNSEADVIGYGGAAGGGKTDLACGKALTQHRKVAMFRREATQLTGIIDRLSELLGGRDGYNGAERIWRGAGPRGVQIEFGSVPNLGDETKHQGRPKDLLVIDEGANFLEQQVRFLMGWVRSTVPGQRTQTLITFNPPTSAEGRWIVDFFGPWIDKRHPLYPTPPGVLRYVAVVDGKDDWSRPDDARPFVLKGGQRVYDFNPADHKPTEIITPQSRTFIPSRISDNPHLMGTGYMTTLQAMPEPLRSQMLNGDFEAGMGDDPWQVIPTAWVEAAMARWKPRSPRGEMLAVGVDVARGGRDSTTIATKHRIDEGGLWFDQPHVYPGSETPDGPRVAGLVVAELRDSAPIMIDVIGVGASPYDVLNTMRLPVYGVNVAEKADATDRSGRLRFFNLRSQLWWRMREALDPANDTGTALPPDKQLLAELCAPKWELQGSTVRVESREEIVKRIGRSPDRATAYILANMDMPKLHQLPGFSQAPGYRPRDYDPMAPAYGGTHTSAPKDHDPFAVLG
jgi:hypothetical protein